MRLIKNPKVWRIALTLSSLLGLLLSGGAGFRLK